jgi:hypothetical protein
MKFRVCVIDTMMQEEANVIWQCTLRERYVVFVG